MFEFRFPKIGETASGGIVVRWLKQVGDPIEKDEPLIEVSTDKIATELAPSQSGILEECLVQEGEEVFPGDILARLRETSIVDTPLDRTIEEKSCSKEKCVKDHDPQWFSPAVLGIAQREGLSFQELQAIAGTGIGGRVSRKDVEEYLGKDKYTYDLAGAKPEVGVVTGLAWTSVGGVTLPVEVNVLKGKGEIVLTGSLGDVMKESARAGISYIRSIYNRFNIAEDFYKTDDIHIHCPEGATPKDGPSAGITMALAVISALTDIPVKNDIAMTGEITLRGRVLAVGGVREKLLAAHRAGINKVLLPKACEADLEEIPKNIRKQMEFVLVENMDQVLDEALVRNGDK